jgi:hypothetical protein
METATREQGRAKLAVLDSGEWLECRGDDERGVHTDAGIHPWAEVLAFRCWSEAHGRWFSVPT